MSEGWKLFIATTFVTAVLSIPSWLPIFGIEPEWFGSQVVRFAIAFVPFITAALGGKAALTVSRHKQESELACKSHEMEEKEKKYAAEMSEREKKHSAEIAAKDAEIARLERELSEAVSAISKPEEKKPVHTHGVTGDLLRSEAGVECIPPKVAKLVVASAEDGWSPKKIGDQRIIDLAYQRCQGLLRREKYNGVSTGAYTGDYGVRREWVDYLSQNPDAYRRVKEISQS